MGNVTAGGVNDGEDDENEFYEVFILFIPKLCLDAGTKSTSDLGGIKPVNRTDPGQF